MTASATPPVSLPPYPQLFLDRRLIAELRGVELRLQQPVRQPLARSPLGNGAYCTVIKDGPRYKAWFRGTDPDYTGERNDGNRGEVTVYCESDDGHEWRYPDLGLHEVAGSRHNSIILAKQPPFNHNFSPFIDPRPVHPEERYKALAGTHKSGLFRFMSADGIHWRKVGEQPVIHNDGFAFDSQNVAFWSVAEKCFVCYYRAWVTPHGRLRSINRVTSPDFINWSKPVETNPNLPGEHLYTSQCAPYCRNPHLYLALPTRFQDKRGASTDLLLMSAHAGEDRFERLFTGPFIRPGLDPERWGNRSNYAALNILPTSPEELSIYHARSGYRYTVRTDGFVAASAESEGELLTQPLVFKGTLLEVNFSGSAGGELRVEVQDEAGQPLPGLALADCQPVIGDAITRSVTWNDGAALAAQAGRPVRLRFALRETELFSFTLR